MKMKAVNQPSNHPKATSSRSLGMSISPSPTTQSNPDMPSALTEKTLRVDYNLTHCQHQPKNMIATEKEEIKIQSNQQSIHTKFPITPIPIEMTPKTTNVHAVEDSTAAGANPTSHQSIDQLLTKTENTICIRMAKQWNGTKNTTIRRISKYARVAKVLSNQKNEY